MGLDPTSLPAHIQAAMARKTTLRHPPTAVFGPIYDHKADRPLPNTEPQRHEAPALGAAVQGEAEGDARTLVRIVGHRVRPLDPDNFAGGCKDLIDGLRHAGLISGDEAWRIRLETEQVKVGSFKEEKTEIEIVTP